MPHTGPLTFGDIDDTGRPLAIAVHGFPDTPHTWRHLGPALAAQGYRVVAPWLPGYDAPATGPISVGTYVRYIGEVRRRYQGDDRCVLVGHDWGANAGYGAVASEPAAYRRLVTLAVPPVSALGSAMFEYRQLKRSFYIWFIQQVGLAEGALAAPGFWESLWADWSPGCDWSEDVAQLRRSITEASIAGIICPYRASFNPDFGDPAVAAEAAATLAPPPVRTLVPARRRRRRDGCRAAGGRERAATGRGIALRITRRSRSLLAPGAARSGRGTSSVAGSRPTKRWPPVARPCRARDRGRPRSAARPETCPGRRRRRGNGLPPRALPSPRRYQRDRRG